MAKVFFRIRGAAVCTGRIIANVVKITAKIGLAANLLNLKDLMRTKDNCLRDGNNR